ncbi:hypothetical protein PGT21_010941 [Puccinia graminis f. sp. tritici]|uniref:Uncharacterized protein n=1 Tax=Puccinia graminis f. sp. tritici TaxID=56615 RepID=A0A5B0MBQ4_PUCGR|nr:hypothetical protein PGT21_010941 [Puccinia graminis f. sp. tritici]
MRVARYTGLKGCLYYRHAGISFQHEKEIHLLTGFNAKCPDFSFQNQNEKLRNWKKVSSTNKMPRLIPYPVKLTLRKGSLEITIKLSKIKSWVASLISKICT